MARQFTLGVIDLSFHRIAGALVTGCLENMAFEVGRVYAPHEEAFQRLKRGECDALTSAWLPSSHGGYKADVETVVGTTELGLHYEPYALWGVPDYVPVEEVRCVADLLKPEVAQKMRKTIQGINPGAGISRFSVKIIEEYGLDKAGYTFLTGTQEQCTGAFEDAVAKGEWAVVPLWQPQFLQYRYAIRDLEEPKGLLGTVDRAVLLMRDDRKGVFSDAEIQQLDALRFSNAIISELDFKVSREMRPLDETCRQWLEAHGGL